MMAAETSVAKKMHGHPSMAAAMRAHPEMASMMASLEASLDNFWRD